MVKNIVVLGLNRDVTRQVSEMLCEQLEMHFLDTIELFEFDNIPRSLSDILREQGERYFRTKEKSLIGFASEFDNTVIHSESGCVLKRSNIEKLKKTCLVIYVHFSPMSIKYYLENKKFKTKEEKKFYAISEDRIKRRIELLSRDCNIRINSTGKSAFKVVSEVLRAINTYYNV